MKKKEYIFAVLLFLIITVIWSWGYNASYFATPDAHDYAQMGRQISNGNGFSTLQIFPRHVSFLDKIGFLKKENWPNLHRYPLPTICNALLYKITNDIVKAAVLMSGVPFLLSIPVLFLLAFKLTDLKTSVLCTIFFASHPLVFESGYNGLSESLAALLILVVFLIGLSGRLSKGRCLAIGITLGFGYLARTQLVSLLPVILLYIWFSGLKKGRLASVVVLFVGFVFVIGPWLARNVAVAGKPTFSFVNTRVLFAHTMHKKSDLEKQLVHPDLDMQLEAPVGISEVLDKYGWAIVKKVWKNILDVFSEGFWGTAFHASVVFVFFLLASFIYRRHCDNRSYNIYRDGIVLFIFCYFLITCSVCHNERYYLPLQSLVCLAGVNEILILFTNPRFSFLRKLRHIVFYGMLLFGLFRLYNVTMIHKHRPSPVSIPEKSSYEFLKQVTSRDSIIVSNTSHRIALYVGCKTIRLPVFPVDLLKINAQYLPIDFVLINRRMGSNYQYSNYSDFINSDVFLQKFKFVKVLPDGSVLFKRL